MIKEYTCNGFFWLFLLLFVAVMVICYFVAVNYVTWYDDLVKTSWLNNAVAFYVVLFLVGLVMTIGSYIAFVPANKFYRAVIFISFLFQILLLVAWTVVFFSVQNLTWAFILSLCIFFVSIIQMYVVWDVKIEAGYAMIPYSLFILLSLFASYHIMDSNKP